LEIDDFMSKRVQNGPKRFELRYKSPESDEMISRKAYLGALVAAGQAVSDAGKVWTFPLMDIGDGINRDYRAAPEQFKSLNSIISPEARINVQLLHAYAEKPKNEDVTEYANEAVCQLDIDETFLAILGVAGVTWSKQLGGRIRFSWWASFDEAETPRGFSGLGDIPEEPAE
jgi:hypothetical protein